MTQILTSVKQSFDASGNATLVVPNGAEIVAWKFYEGDTSDLNQQVGVVFLIDDAVNAGTHMRMFELLPDGHPVPPNYKAYKAGPLPYGPSKIIVHCIEVFPPHNETGSFNPGKAVIT
jgi:hypothetical protein